MGCKRYRLADGRIVHYHYDLDGRLISETDGTTGFVTLSASAEIWFWALS